MGRGYRLLFAPHSHLFLRPGLMDDWALPVSIWIRGAIMEMLRVDLWTPCWVLILLGEVSDLGMATDHPPPG